MNKKQKKRVILLGTSAFVLMVLALTLFLSLQRYNMTPSETFRVNITDEMSYSQLVDTLDCHQSIGNHAIFGTIAHLMKLPSRMHPGSYKIAPNANMLATIRRFCIGGQDPIRITINKHRTIESFCTFIGNKLQFSADTLLAYLQSDSVCSRYGLSPATIFALFPQNTYEFYWTITPTGFLNKMEQESDRFWESRQLQLESLKMTREQVLTIASIVEEETNCNDEKADIASVYLNRLRIGMALQADPTVKYAVGDFTIRRIRGEMLQYDSPYNTYRYAGLPPGPICIPSAASIDAVLKNKKTEYLYFCAKEDFSGRHNFAATIAEHQANAKRFHKALNTRNIK